jgi:glycosyltransferase involved in cell wall biosynthesis
MKIAYANTTYHPNSPGGGNAHVGQFITQAVALGHEVWSWSSNQHPGVRQLPHSTWQRLITLRNMDAICIRIDDRLPIKGYSRWSIAPYKQLIGSPIIAWEFNTVPEFGLLRGRTEAEVQQEIKKLKDYGKGCDLAICVSQALTDYVKTHLGIKRVITIPNGSDPELFRPDITPVSRVQRHSDKLNVVWIGSGNLSWHNFDLLKDTAKILWDKNQAAQITFHIIGSGHSLMKEMPLNVNYYGSENYQLLPQWLAAMDVGLCLYRPGAADYSSPLKVFDYMSSGLTVVGTEQPQLREIFSQLNCSDLLVPHNNPQALADVLSQLANNRDRVRYQGQLCRQLVINYYNWSRAVQDTINELKSLTNKKNQSQFFVGKFIENIN